MPRAHRPRNPNTFHSHNGQLFGPSDKGVTVAGSTRDLDRIHPLYEDAADEPDPREVRVGAPAGGGLPPDLSSLAHRAASGDDTDPTIGAGTGTQPGVGESGQVTEHGNVVPFEGSATHTATGDAGAAAGADPRTAIAKEQGQLDAPKKGKAKKAAEKK